MDAAAALSRRQRDALPGSSRDSLFSLLKVALPSAAVVVLAAIVIWPLVEAQEFSFLLAKDKVEAATERLRIDRAEYRGETARGEAFSIRAGGAVQRSSAVPIVELTDLSARLRMADGPAVVTAPAGRYFIDKDMLQITGPVRLDSAAGYRLDSRTVDIDLNARTVVTDQPVTGVLPIGRFSANSLAGDIQGRHVVLDGGVHLRIDGRAGKGAL